MSAIKYDALITIDDCDNEGNHRLQSYCLWYSKKASGKSHQNSFEKNFQLIGSFATCEKFWQNGNKCHLVRPSDLTADCDFYLFKKGIKPLWEGEANRYGGKWSVRLPKGTIDEFKL